MDEILLHATRTSNSTTRIEAKWTIGSADFSTFISTIVARPAFLTSILLCRRYKATRPSPSQTISNFPLLYIKLGSRNETQYLELALTLINIILEC